MFSFFSFIFFSLSFSLVFHCCFSLPSSVLPCFLWLLWLDSHESIQQKKARKEKRQQKEEEKARRKTNRKSIFFVCFCCCPFLALYLFPVCLLVWQALPPKMAKPWKNLFLSLFFLVFFVWLVLSYWPNNKNTKQTEKNTKKNKKTHTKKIKEKTKKPKNKTKNQDKESKNLTF